MPIKIKLKAEKESKFKDIDNAEWDRDFELEITNTSDKPIYFLDLWLIYSGITTPGGGRVGAVLRFVGQTSFILTLDLFRQTFPFFLARQLS
ncbi:MAG TPA: hypothetical protein VNG71_12755 [Pyrinomonadaceae bacterium]|nr:hypothetical protein [Pyrinomonadaceae bacterium]